jgi:transcriptional regulator with XRE-family HTH domain
MADEKSTFDKLVELRNRSSISQKAMASYLGLTNSTMNRYENGNRSISAKLQDQYASKLGFELKLMVK